MKKRRIFRLAAAAAALCLLAACGTGKGGDGSAFAPAQQERLVIYTSHKEEVWWPIVREFEERTGIWVDVVTGGTNELLERIRLEADSPAADVMFGGGVESLESYNEYFTPYLCPDAGQIASRYRAESNLWTPFSALPVVLIYNPKLVAPGQLSGWTDLLRPEFRGKIAFADPAVSASCYTGLVTMLCALDAPQEETLRRFAENLDGRLLAGSGDILSSVADGTDCVGITLEETALRRIAAGENLRMVYPAEGTSAVPDGSALLRGAKHEENAKRFLDFTVSRDVQALIQEEEFSRRSVRGDIEPSASLPQLDKLSMVDYDAAWASRERGNILKSWQSFLPLEETP